MSSPRFASRAGYTVQFEQSDEAWQSRAACRNVPLSTQRQFTQGKLSPLGARPLVQGFCHRCSVRADCLDWAYDDRTFTGVAGGVLFKENGSGSRERATIRIAVAMEDGYAVAVEREKHYKARRRHLVDDKGSNSARSWRALCGARCSPNKIQEHEEQALAAAACGSCQRIKKERNDGAQVR
ncbi:WhiB family transcriptional regulator [Streptomyces sp. NPDC048611]|uniref:WhiB family transcriptional regulator n=1 Tax=Streptomyces sp. NPDC048611 TaxID=3155635 RepID=UPI0034133199